MRSMAAVRTWRSGERRAGRLRGAPPAIPVAVLLTLPALSTHLSPAAARALEYDRAAIAAGELWRLLTCHWTHWSGEHLIWDALVFALLVALAWSHGRARLLAALGAAALAIPLAVWTLLPAMERYRGLSGLDATLFVLLAAALLRRDLAAGGRLRAAVALALLLAFAGKVAYETLTASTLFVDAASSGFIPVPLAHTVGGACGLAAALIPGRGRIPRPRKRSRPSSPAA